MRRLAAVLPILLAFLACAGCKKDGPSPAADPAAPAPPKQLSEKEPNGTPESALSLAEPAKVTAELKAEPADEDYFRLEQQGAGKLARFEVSGIPGCDLALELLDRDGNHLAVINSEAEGKGEVIENLNLASPWLVKVYAAKKGSGGAYTVDLSIKDAEQDFEVEPNNRAVDATALELGKPVRGLLADRADEDWYRFEIAVPSLPAAANPPAPEAADAAAEATGAGQTADAAPAVNAAEPGQAQAVPAVAGGERAAPSAVPAVVAPAAGTEALPPAVVKLDISGVPDVRLQVEISNQAQAVFYTAKSRELGEGIQVRNLALRPGETTYYVTVKSSWSGSGKDAKRGYNTAVPYTLAITAEDAQTNAELEPNDEPAKATPLTVDGVRQGFFAPKGDVDYFLARCDRPQLLKVELSGVDRVDSMLSVVKVAEGSDKEEVLAKANDGGVKEGEILLNLACAPGKDVLLKVEAAPRQVNGKWVRDQENPTEPYRLTVTGRPDDNNDEREPNNQPETATPVELGRPMKGFIHPKKDVDLFRVDLSSSPVKVPLKATVTGILKVDVSLALYRLDEKGKPVLVQRSEKGRGEQPETIRFTVEPGVYLVEVRDTRNSQSNWMDPYQLTVEQEQ